ncbi:PepSY domain-containing protein [Zooshikella ganghwensis]|uniref:Peptidase n=1 Tax=Zooshikella ganghwensis TaxID=202772 RepID=A0A4P9VK84_9GAMM|nr:PepSY domain-containing protein [Zooshikella ganghwensis]RDH42222.1 peptidase [Zooshikella ganghwensis]
MKFTTAAVKLSLCFTCLCLAISVHSDENLSPEQAQDLQKKGIILPFNQLLAIARQQHPGKLLDAELEYDDGFYEYEFKILDEQGIIWEIELNAQTGEITEVEEDD